MRVEGVALEHHRDVAILGVDVVDHASIDGDLAAADVLEARQHAQQRRLAAARGSDQDHELALGNVERDAVQHARPAELLHDLAHLRRDPAIWKNFQGFSASYKRIRVGWIAAARHRRNTFEQRLRYFLKMTKLNKRFGMVQ